MKATLDYDLTDCDDEIALRRALKATSYLVTLEELDEWLRGQIKYHDKNEFQPVRDELHNLLTEHDVQLHKE